MRHVDGHHKLIQWKFVIHGGKWESSVGFAPVRECIAREGLHTVNAESLILDIIMVASTLGSCLRQLILIKKNLI